LKFCAGDASFAEKETSMTYQKLGVQNRSPPVIKFEKIKKM